MPFANVASVGLRLFARDELTGALDRAGKSWARFIPFIGKSMAQVSSALRGGGTQAALAMGMLGPIAMEASMAVDRASAWMVGSLKSVIQAASEYQSVLVQIGVISEASASDMQALASEILRVTADLPTSATELAKASLAFAKMGFTARKSAEEIAKMGMQAVYFGRAIGVSDEKAAMFLGKLATWLGISSPTINDMERMANTVTKLGWRIKGTAQDVIKATERFGAFVSAMGASGDEVLALGALVQDSGILIRRGSTAINRTFQLMAANTSRFGAAMVKSGVVETAAEFTDMFRTRPVEAFTRALQSLEAQHGADAAMMLKQLGLHGNYVSDLITMSRNLSRFNMIRKEARKEWTAEDQARGAAQQAYKASLGTYADSMKVFTGAITNLKIAIGSDLLSYLSDLLKYFADMGKSILELDSGLLRVIGWFLLAATVILLFAKYIKTAVMVVKAFRMAQMTMMASISKGLFILIALIVVVILGYAAIAVAIKRARGEQTSFSEELKATTDSMKKASGQVVEGLTGGLMGPGTTGPDGTNVAPNVGAATAADQAQLESLMAFATAKEGLPKGSMHTGGIALSPQTLMVGDREPEAFMPLSVLPGIIAQAMAQVPQRSDTRAAGGEMRFSVNLNNVEIARQRIDQEQIEAIRRGRPA